MFFYKIKNGDNPEIMVELWEETRCLVCKVHKAKVFIADENGAFKLSQEIKIEQSTYISLQMLYSMGSTKEPKAVDYINTYILSDLNLLFKRELSEIDIEN